MRVTINLVKFLYVKKSEFHNYNLAFTGLHYICHLARFHRFKIERHVCLTGLTYSVVDRFSLNDKVKKKKLGIAYDTSLVHP
jgi:hypothetical protein